MALNFIKARTKPCILGPTLPRECKRTALTTSSTQHMWELLAGNHTARPTKVRGLTIIRMKSTTYTDYKTSARFSHEF